jgi:hypothetical protein
LSAAQLLPSGDCTPKAISRLLPVHASPVPNDGLDALSDNIYHAYILKPHELDHYYTALYVKEIFLRDNHFEAVAKPEGKTAAEHEGIGVGQNFEVSGRHPPPQPLGAEDEGGLMCRHTLLAYRRSTSLLFLHRPLRFPALSLRRGDLGPGLWAHQSAPASSFAGSSQCHNRPFYCRFLLVKLVDDILHVHKSFLAVDVKVERVHPKGRADPQA